MGIGGGLYKEPQGHLPENLAQGVCFTNDSEFRRARSVVENWALTPHFTHEEIVSQRSRPGPRRRDLLGTRSSPLRGQPEGWKGLCPGPQCPESSHAARLPSTPRLIPDHRVGSAVSAAETLPHCGSSSVSLHAPGPNPTPSFSLSHPLCAERCLGLNTGRI